MTLRLLLALFFSLLALAPAAAIEPKPPGIVEVVVGGETFKIPRNYLLYVHPSSVGDKNFSAQMFATWPGMEKLSEATKHLWERRYPKRWIRFAVQDRMRGKDPYVALMERVERGKDVADSEPNAFGLLRYSYGKWESFVAADGSLLTPSGTPVVFRCNDITTDEMKELFDVQLVCIVEYVLKNKVWLHYSFFLVNLEHWREIDQAVRSLVLSFMA